VEEEIIKDYLGNQTTLALICDVVLQDYAKKYLTKVALKTLPYRFSSHFTDAIEIMLVK